MISVVIRTKNEAEWIDRCLRAVFGQDCPGLEVVLVDNQSKDGTVAAARAYPCRVLEISDAEFTYGRALNLGIGETHGELVAILSGHCVPRHELWLQCLNAALENPQVAGAYGRQEPLPDSSASDKRDLWTTFGIERRLQRQEPFFHNANSMIRRSVWQAVPFNEELKGLEDRHWGRAVLGRGYSLVYEPQASVYHHHGLHHGGEAARAERVARGLESLQAPWGVAATLASASAFPSTTEQPNRSGGRFGLAS